jgi:DNA-binding MarR family transcriptional regulator
MDHLVPIVPAKDQKPRRAPAKDKRYLAAERMKNSVPYMIKAVARLQTKVFMSRLSNSGVFPSETFVLLELYQQEPLSQSELSRRLDTSHSTIGKTLIRLERSGFITRERLSDDRRIIMVRLTREGHDVHEHVFQEADLLAAEIEAVLGKAAAAGLLTWLKLLAEHFRT